jgi:Uri superfamily endonuclease
MIAPSSDRGKAKDPEQAGCAGPGAYVLVIELTAPFALDHASLPRARLLPGRYAYCGSAYGPGGLKARIARHLRRDKPIRWHVDHLTKAGRIVDVQAVPGGRECDLLRLLLAQHGTSVPVPGFGSSDCRRCPAHLVALPPHGGLETIPELA